MRNSIFTQAAQFLRDRRDNRRWQVAVCCLAALVVCGTMWSLVRQGQALNGSERDVLDCRFEVHEHSADCYEDERLVCGKVEYVVHTHDSDSCYDEDGGLVCLLPEEEGHVHDADCFEIEESLVCGLEEGEVDSYEESSGKQGGSFVSYAQGTEPICGQEEHIHTDACYEVEVSEERILACGQKEQMGHIHDNGCYTVTEEITQICGQDEYTGHTHTDACYDSAVDEESGESILTQICGQEEQAGHSHDDGCYTVTTQSELTCGQEEQAGHSHGNDCYEVNVSEEIIRICGQEEHTHSDDCYDSVDQDADNVRNEPAADDAAGHIHSDDCYLLVRRLVCREEGVHTHDAGCYQNGTLICTAPEVKSLEEHVHGPECFAAGEEEEYIKIFMNDDIIVTAVYRTSAGIPEDARMDVEQIMDKGDERYENCLAELEETEGALADDEEPAMLLGFGFYTVDERFVPEDTVNLTVQFLNDSIYAEGDEVTVACFGENGVDLISGTEIDEEGLTTFDVDNLSELAFIASVEKSGVRDLVYEGEDYIVTVGLEEDSAVPEDAELLVEKITQEDFESYVECFERLDEAGVLDDNETPAMLLDMKIYAEDKEIVPDEIMEVKVQFLTREIYFEGDAVKAAHITADDIELLDASDIDGELSTTFTVDELAGAAFIIDGDVRTMTAEGEDYIITVRFGPKALIPEDAELVAERITEESDLEHFTARADQLQEEITDERITLGALFNIGFYGADGMEIEPQSAVDVKIQLFDEGGVEKADSVKVAHFVGDEENAEESVKIIEDADVTKDGDGSLSTIFQTESFRIKESRSTEE